MKCVSKVALPFLLLGCSMEDEKGTLSPVASLFNADDLSSGTVNPISAGDISDIIAAEGEFWAHVDATTLAESTTCMNAMLDKLPLKADKANVSLVAEMDAKECFASADLGLNVTSAPFRFAMWLGCQNKELEELNGKTFGELGDHAALKCDSESEQKTLVNMEFKVLATGELETDSGTTAKVDYGYRSITATQTLNGDPCTLTSIGDGWLWSSDCVSVNKQEVTQMDLDGKSLDDALTADYLRLVYVDIVESKDSAAPWYESGRFDVKLNDWTGSVNYNGANAAPSWSLKSGTSEASGTLGLAPLKAAKLLPWARLIYRPRK